MLVGMGFNPADGLTVTSLQPAAPASGANTTELIDNHTAAQLMSDAQNAANATAAAQAQAAASSNSHMVVGAIVGVGLLFGWAMLAGKSHGLMGARL